MDLLFLPALFVVASAYFIGQAVGESVPDEVKLWRKHFRSSADALLVLALCVISYDFGLWWLGVLASIAFLIARYYSLDLAALVNGVLLAIAAMAADAAVMVLVLAACFLLGIGEKKKTVWRNAFVQTVVALLVWGFWWSCLLF